MSKMIFINLPVADLPAAKTFYTALGFVNEPKFTDETAAAMQWSETIFVMLLTHDKWRGFTSRLIPDASSGEVMLALTLDSRDEVSRLTELAGTNGGTTDPNPQQDHGFMFSRSFLDLDGHLWETFWMDASMAESGAHAATEA